MSKYQHSGSKQCSRCSTRCISDHFRRPNRHEAGDAAAERLKEEEKTAAKEENETFSSTEIDTPAEISLIAESVEAVPDAATPSEQPQPVIPLAAEPKIEVHGDEITMWQQDRKYRVRGLGKNTSYEVMNSKPRFPFIPSPKRQRKSSRVLAASKRLNSHRLKGGGFGCD